MFFQQGWKRSRSISIETEPLWMSVPSKCHDESQYFRRQYWKSLTGRVMAANVLTIETSGELTSSPLTTSRPQFFYSQRKQEWDAWQQIELTTWLSAWWQGLAFEVEREMRLQQDAYFHAPIPRMWWAVTLQYSSWSIWSAISVPWWGELLQS